MSSTQGPHEAEIKVSVMAALSPGVQHSLSNSLVDGKIQFLVRLNSSFNFCLLAGGLLSAPRGHLLAMQIPRRHFATCLLLFLSASRRIFVASNLSGLFYL